MALGGVFPKNTDGGLSRVAPSGDGIRVVIGQSQLGTVNEVLTFTDPQKVKDILGRGKLTDAVSDSLAIGGGVVYAVKAATSITGGIYGTNTGMTLTGTGDEFLQVRIRFDTAGAVAVATFSYSLDGGETYKGSYLTSASYVIPNTPLTLALTGTFTAGQIGAWSVESASSTVGDIQSAVNAVLNGGISSPFELIHIAQPCDFAMVTALDVLATTAENSFRYFYFVAEARPIATGGTETVDQWVAALVTAKAAFSSKRVAWVAAFGQVVDVLTGLKPVRNLASKFTARRAKGNLQESLGWVAQGSLQGLLYAAPFTTGTYGKTVQFNNGHSTTLDNAGFTTVCTHVGRSGYYFVDGTMTADSTSDYRTVANRAIMDKATHLSRLSLLDFVNQAIDPSDLDISLAGIKAAVESVLGSMKGASEITGYVVGFQTGQNILSTSTLRVKISIVPFGYTKFINVELGFSLPVVAVPVAPTPV